MLYLVGLEHSQCSAIKLMCACKILVQSYELFCVELTLSYLQAIHSNIICVTSSVSNPVCVTYNIYGTIILF